MAAVGFQSDGRQGGEKVWEWSWGAGSCRRVLSVRISHVCGCDCEQGRVGATRPAPASETVGGRRHLFKNERCDVAVPQGAGSRVSCVDLIVLEHLGQFLYLGTIGYSCMNICWRSRGPVTLLVCDDTAAKLPRGRIVAS